MSICGSYFGVGDLDCRTDKIKRDSTFVYNMHLQSNSLVGGF